MAAQSLFPRVERFEAAFLGLALGDALGAPHEGGVLERGIWRVLGRTRDGKRRWTDDTQMSLDLAESLLQNGRLDADDVAMRFARSYRWSRGYGPGAAKLLKRIRLGADWREANRSVFPEGSFGNGGAMRVPVIGLFHLHSREDAARDAAASARITHAHPLAIEGAVLLAIATRAACLGREPAAIMQEASEFAEDERYRERLATARDWLNSEALVSTREVRLRLGNGIAALDSVVTAIYLALRFYRAQFSSLLAWIAELRGDVDTIGAMAGALFGAMNGVNALPLGEPLEQRDRLQRVARALHGAVDGEHKTSSLGFS